MISRQRAYQARHLAAGRCVLCSRPAVRLRHCTKHRRLSRGPLPYVPRRIAWAIGYAFMLGHGLTVKQMSEWTTQPTPVIRHRLAYLRRLGLLPKARDLRG